MGNVHVGKAFADIPSAERILEGEARRRYKPGGAVEAKWVVVQENFLYLFRIPVSQGSTTKKNGFPLENTKVEIVVTAEDPAKWLQFTWASENPLLKEESSSSNDVDAARQLGHVFPYEKGRRGSVGGGHMLQLNFATEKILETWHAGILELQNRFHSIQRQPVFIIEHYKPSFQFHNWLYPCGACISDIKLSSGAEASFYLINGDQYIGEVQSPGMSSTDKGLDAHPRFRFIRQGRGYVIRKNGDQISGNWLNDHLLVSPPHPPIRWTSSSSSGSSIYYIGYAALSATACSDTLTALRAHGHGTLYSLDGLNGSRSEWEGTWVHGSLRAGSHKRIATISSSRQPGSSSLDDSTTVYEVYEGPFLNILPGSGARPGAATAASTGAALCSALLPSFSSFSSPFFRRGSSEPPADVPGTLWADSTPYGFKPSFGLEPNAEQLADSLVYFPLRHGSSGTVRFPLPPGSGEWGVLIRASGAGGCKTSDNHDFERLLSEATPVITGIALGPSLILGPESIARAACPGAGPSSATRFWACLSARFSCGKPVLEDSNCSISFPCGDRYQGAIAAVPAGMLEEAVTYVPHCPSGSGILHFFHNGESVRFIGPFVYGVPHGAGELLWLSGGESFRAVFEFGVIRSKISLTVAALRVGLVAVANLEKSLEDLRAQQLRVSGHCMRCRNAAIDSVFLPCAHRVLCFTCAEKSGDWDDDALLPPAAAIEEVKNSGHPEAVRNSGGDDDHSIEQFDLRDRVTFAVRQARDRRCPKCQKEIAQVIHTFDS